MDRRETLSLRSLPPAPQTAAAWLALTEIPAGRYLFAEIGWLRSGRESAVAAGVAELPPPAGAIDNGYVALPAVTVVGDDGKMRMFRLPICYAALIRQLVSLDDFVWRDGRLAAESVTELPCHFIVGGREDVYLRAQPEGARTVLN
jgi:hypothetical protein